MLARMELVYLDKGFPGDTVFPYTASHLAGALTQMIMEDLEKEKEQESNTETEKEEEDELVNLPEK